MEHPSVMVDLETMGAGPSAAIVAIGAVDSLGREFYRTVDLASSVTAGGVIDPSTVMWWMGQSDEARAALTSPGAVHIVQALTEFSAWVADLGADVRVWGNGAAFDNVILGGAYDRSGLPRPWAFWNDRCYRTIKSLRPGIKMSRTGTHHNALDDARSQADHLRVLLAAGNGAA